MREIQKADPRTRRWAIVVFLGCVALGTSGILFFLRYLPTLEAGALQAVSQDSQRFSRVFGLSGTLLFLPLLMMAVYLWQIGRRVVRTQRFPPPGIAVIRDTPVLQGQVAQRQGLIIQGLAVLLLVLICIAIGCFWSLTQLLTVAAQS